MRSKLSYRFFHNLNSAEATTDYILQVLVDMNRTKIENLLREASPPQRERDTLKDAVISG